MELVFLIYAQVEIVVRKKCSLFWDNLNKFSRIHFPFFICDNVHIDILIVLGVMLLSQPSMGHISMSKLRDGGQNSAYHLVNILP